MLESPASELDVTTRQLALGPLAGGVGLPVLVAVVFVLLADPTATPWWQRFDAGLWLGFGLCLGFAGVCLGTAWTGECRIAFGLGVAALVGVIVWPAIGFGESPDVVFALGGTAFVVLPLLVLAVPAEYLYRTNGRERLSPTRLEAIAPRRNRPLARRPRTANRPRAATVTARLGGTRSSRWKAPRDVLGTVPTIDW
ncbi:hypothetical protein D8Y22_06330 [Salinadaptatus halalkaliphilus]|uniref:Uncharacterized protein n=1 Tax=Salinadaptatus halalkaliphilus TaxID=2419781 RepID=A0A4S3TNA1_9EURY|nr:hypothetical protein [Salinadaptatus halalkaliphilus]THE65779.1 hypothetical protein D8Y22_06330 [Salinadaptatus halalkaliphilus]